MRYATGICNQTLSLHIGGSKGCGLLLPYIWIFFKIGIMGMLCRAPIVKVPQHDVAIPLCLDPPWECSYSVLTLKMDVICNCLYNIKSNFYNRRR